MSDLLSQLPCSALVTDRMGQVLFANAELLTLVGGSASDWLGRPMDLMLVPASRIFLQSYAWPMLLRQEKVREIYLHLCGTHEKRIPVMVNCHEGDFEGEECYFWIFFVAQERSRFEVELLEARGQAQRMTAKLADEHELLRVTLLSIGDAVIATDPAGNITWVNPSAERFTGWGASEASGQPLMQVFHIVNDATRAPSENSVMTCLQEGVGDGRAEQSLLLARNGGEFYIEHSASPIRNSRGDTLGLVLVFHDVTERRRLEQMKSDFVSTVSHELRTPLTSINGALGLVCGGALGTVSEQAKTVLDIAYKNSQRLTLLINDLLDMEKLVAGKMDFDLQLQNLMPLVEQSIESTQAYAQQYQVRLMLKVRTDGIRVKVDGSRLQQVLSNFLSNAAKFSPQGGEVEVLVSLGVGVVRVTVIDHGAGIPEHFKARIFQKFSQADTSTTRQKGGTGLGLAISKELIERMNGVVGFNSAPGQDTCFYFELPHEGRGPVEGGAALVDGVA